MDLLLNLFGLSVMILIVSAVVIANITAWVYFINWIK